jgi:hypothetical protein
MDERSRDAYPQISVSTWKLHGYLDQGESRSCTSLTSSIHPIFGFLMTTMKPYGKIESLPRWGSLTIEEYECLEPMLRLASLLLLSPASLRFYHSIIYTTRRQTSTTHRNLPVYEFSRSGVPESEVSEQTLYALEKLAGSLSFQFLDDIVDDSCAVATPCLGINSNGISIIPAEKVTGLGGFVKINRRFLRLLQQLLKRPYIKHKQILGLQLQVASLSCHELAHVINFAADISFLKAILESRHENQPLAVPNEPFFENQPVAELGYCWMNEVFGGNIPYSYDPTEAIMLEEWPSWVSRSTKREPERRLPRVTSTMSLISVQYMRDIQSQKWWESLSDRRINDRLLHPPKTFSLCIMNDEGTDCSVESDQRSKTMAAKGSLGVRLKGWIKGLIS